MAHETRRHRACAVSLVLCALVLLCVCPDTTAQSDDCVACRFTFGYSYEFFAGHHIEVRNTPDRRYFPTNGLLSFSLFIFLSPFYHLMRCNARAHASTGLSYQFWMFPYDVTSGRPQSIIGNLFAKDATLQYYNTGFYLHNDRLLFVSGPLDFGAETNCLSLSLCHFPSWHTLTAFCFCLSSVYPSATVQARRWVHVTGTVVVEEGTTTMVLYINGLRVSEKAVDNITMWPFDPRVSLFVARDEEEQIIPYRYFTGLLDEIRYYSFVFSL